MMLDLLVVDDSESVRETLRIVFGALGLSVSAAEHGAAALAFFEQEQFSAALIDIHMPGANGFDVCRELRARAEARGQSLCVWLMTAAITPDFPQRAADAGALGILSKPFDVRELARDIRGRISETTDAHADQRV